MANTKVTKAVLADDAVGLDQLDISNDPSDGQALTYDGNSTNLQWATVGVSGIDSSADATAITIDSSERVAIGSSTANKIFNIADPNQGGETLKLHFEAFSSDDKWAIYSYDRTNGHVADLSFGSNYMYLKSGGNVGIGTTSPSSSFHVVESNTGTTPTTIIENTTGTVATTAVLLDLKFSGDTSFSNIYYIKFQDSSGEEGGIRSDGTGRVYYEITSDYRKKENIVDYTGGLDVINNLSVKNYNMISRPNITHTGFIAHEVQDVIEGVAFGEKDAVDDEGNPIYQGLDMSKLVPHLVSAIQELKTELDTAKARIETLESN